MRIQNKNSSIPNNNTEIARNQIVDVVLGLQRGDERQG